MGIYKISTIEEFNSLTLSPGDSVLFERGKVYRGGIKLTAGSDTIPITYGAYGDGYAPILIGSENISNPGQWHETKPNIWACDSVCGEVGNLIFEDGDTFGTLVWSESELKAQGDFYDNCFGLTNNDKPLLDEHSLYMYSTTNPATLYRDIEASTFVNRAVIVQASNVIIQDLCIKNNSVHGIATDKPCKNVVIKNCTFNNIGGAVYSTALKVRFGNGVEFWNVAENVTVEDCVFDNIYDSAVTHQGSHDICSPAVGFVIQNNRFSKCGMAAYEQRDRMTIASKFINNVCENAGEGFSKQGEVMPRRSEIWPKPMGHHIFLWRIDGETEGGGLEIKNNTFGSAPNGASIYSIIDPTAEAQVYFENNTYDASSQLLVFRWGGTDYKTINMSTLD